MSIKVMSEIWDKSPNKGSVLLAELALGDYANDQGIAWPAIATLARKIRMSEAYTKMIIRQLVDSGRWKVVKIGGGSHGATNHYKYTGEAGLPRGGKPASPHKSTTGEAGLPRKANDGGGGPPLRGEAGLPQTVINHQDQESISVNDSSAAAEGRTEKSAAAAAAVLWGFGSVDLSMQSIRKLEAAGATPEAYVCHYFQALCNPRIKSASGAAVRATLDGPQGPEREPWSLLATYDPIQMAEALLAVERGEYVAGSMRHVAQALNGRHETAAAQAIHDLGLVDIAGRIRAQRDAAAAAALEEEFVPAPKPQLTPWEQIMACSDPVHGHTFRRYRHMFEDARLLDVRADGVLVVEISRNAYDYLHSGDGHRRRMDSMFGHRNFEWRVRE